MVKIAAIIVASGISRRFGSDKLMYNLNGKHMINYILQSVSEAKFNQRLLIVNNREKFSNLAGKCVQIFENENYINGMSSSIITGIHELNSDIEGAMVIPADMPFIDYKILNYMMDIFADCNCGIVGIMQGDIIMSPMIFRRKYFKDLLELRGDHGGKKIVEKNIDDFIGINIDKKFLLDIDTIQDLNKIGHDDKLPD
ncbi:MAG: nucleotidyltransferase family protein [Ferroplasma sp.]